MSSPPMVLLLLNSCHGTRHHLLTNPGPLVFAKPRRLDPEKLAAAQEEFYTMEKKELFGDLPLPGPLLIIW